MASSKPAVSVDPNLDTGGWSVGSAADQVFGFIAANPVPVVLLVFAIILAKWLTKPFMKGIILGCLLAAIVVYAIGAM